MANANTTSPDYSNLSPAMSGLLDLLEGYWEEADEHGDAELAWCPCTESNTVAALQRRGFPVLTRSTYYGQEARLADPHPSGLGY